MPFLIRPPRPSRAIGAFGDSTLAGLDPAQTAAGSAETGASTRPNLPV
jgi:hypothetical protein